MAQVTVHQTLTVGDLMRAAEAISAALDSLDAETIQAIQSPEADKMEVGRKVISVALQVAPDAGQRFLAGLVDHDPAAFEQLPADAVLDIIEELMRREDVAGFFKRARGLAESITPGQGGGESSAAAAS